MSVGGEEIDEGGVAVEGPGADCGGAGGETLVDGVGDDDGGGVDVAGAGEDTGGLTDGEGVGEAEVGGGTVTADGDIAGAEAGDCARTEPNSNAVSIRRTTLE